MIPESPGFSHVAGVCQVGCTLRQLDLRAKYGINGLAVRHGDQMEVVPDANFVFETDDMLVAMGQDEKLEKLGMGN